MYEAINNKKLAAKNHIFNGAGKHILHTYILHDSEIKQLINIVSK